MTARWSARQRAMLEAMGLRLWDGAAPPVPATAAATATAGASVGAASAVPPRPAALPASPAAAAPPDRVPRAPGVDVRRTPAVAAAPAAPGLAVPAHAAAHAAAAMPPPAGATTGARRAGAAAVPAGVPAVPAVPADVASMDWETLERTVAGCLACPLAARRTHTVFGAGRHEAHWMVIGEAPGEQEDLSGEPFVGASGRLLDRMLAALGLARDAAEPERQVYIANTVKCRPPGNRNPQPAELAACEAYLARQIALVRPRVILALGRVAAHWLLRTDLPLGRLRGRAHRYEGVPLVVTYHPAYLLRQAEDKARAWDDLCLAREVVAAAAPHAVPAG